MSEEVALNGTFTLSITTNPGYAVDTIQIDSTTYMNDGKSDPPPNSSWLTVTLENVVEEHIIVVTFSQSTDDTGVADKYKHTVTASAESGGTVSPELQKVVDGGTASVTITPDENKAVDTISVNGTEYVNDGK